MSSLTEASEARLEAFMYGRNFHDTANTFLFPTRLFEYEKDFVVVNSGSQVASLLPSNSAYGQILKVLSDDMRMSISYGRSFETASEIRNTFNTLYSENIPALQNPVLVTLAGRSQGEAYSVTFYHSDYRDKVSSSENQAMGIQLGHKQGNLESSVTIDLLNYYNDSVSGVSYRVDQPLRLITSYRKDQFYLQIQFESYRERKSTGLTEDYNIFHQDFKFSLVDEQFVDLESLFFYRIDYTNLYKIDRRIAKETRYNKIPFTMGFEDKALPWLTLRGSLQQTVLINSSSDAIDDVNTTKAAAGVGLLFNHVTIDATLSGLVGSTTANQKIDGNQLLGEAGLTYLF